VGSKLLVLRSLFLGGAQRFNSLLHSVDGISAKELTRNLRELENAGIVERGGATGPTDALPITRVDDFWSMSGLQETKMPNSSRYLRHDAAKRCAIGDGKFGLIRYYSWRTALCSKKCAERFRTRQKGDRKWLR
jgi:hypothetical protein